MEIRTAQQDVRKIFLGGFAGQLVSAMVWTASAAFATWGSRFSAAAVLVFGGMLIFPLTQAVLRLMRRPASLPAGHPMNALGMQVAFVLPLCLPLVYAASVHHAVWFYPAFMVLVGAHYLPFIFLYGMPQFGALAGILVAAGILIALYLPHPFGLGAWFTAAILLLFAVIGLRASRQ